METKQLTPWDNPMENLTIKYTPPSWASLKQVPIVFLYQPIRSYNDDFPALQEQVKDRVRTLPQVHNPQGVDVDGRPK